MTKHRPRCENRRAWGRFPLNDLLITLPPPPIPEGLSPAFHLPLLRYMAPVPATRFERQPDLEMRFPPLPRTLAEVTRLLADAGEVPDTRRLADVTSADPVIAAAVLRRINSAYYGLRRRVGDLRKAVFLLGFLEVCNIVLTGGIMKLRDVLSSDEQAAIFERIMRMGVGAASYTQELALRLSLPLKHLAFTTGLLHIAGRLVLLYNKPDNYEALWFTCDTGRAPTIRDERTIFGTDYTELGGLAADQWHLPEDVARIIQYHLRPQLLPSVFSALRFPLRFCLFKRKRKKR